MTDDHPATYDINRIRTVSLCALRNNKKSSFAREGRPYANVERPATVNAMFFTCLTSKLSVKNCGQTAEDGDMITIDSRHRSIQRHHRRPPASFLLTKIHFFHRGRWQTDRTDGEKHRRK